MNMTFISNNEKSYAKGIYHMEILSFSATGWKNIGDWVPLYSHENYDLRLGELKFSY